jgi:myo-inositol-1(or 4)-monophosphatase
VSEPDPPALRDAAVEMAHAAGAILRDGWGREHRPDRKGMTDLVTEYDRRSEALLLAEIARRFPGDAVLAEESGPHAGGATRWIVDPLDGTTNFAHNYPFFCVSIGVERDGALVAGVVHDPIRDETFAAALGHGATLNGQPIRVSAIDAVHDALIVTGFPYDVRERPERSMPLFTAFLTRAQAIRRDGSAALNFAYLACGRFDGFWEGFLSPWDMAAGVLLVREAGGRVSAYDGGAFDLGGREVLASNGAIHEAMRGIVAAVEGARLDV